MSAAVVLDASAVLAWRDQDPDAHDLVDAVLDGALLCAVNAGEVRYKAAETGDEPDALIADLTALGVHVVPFTDAEARHFPALRDIDRRTRNEQKEAGRTGTRRLSLADLACLALAVERDARVITGDGHWSTLTRHGLTVPVTDYRAPRP